MNPAVLALAILPLCVLVALGWVAGRLLKIEAVGLARLVIFILAPFVNFIAIAQLDLKAAYLLLPVVLFAISVFITLSSYGLARRVFSEARASLVGMGSATGNTGYFGLPVAVALLGPGAAGVYLLMNLAFVFAESTVGYYVGARGHYDVRESLRKLARLPTCYAVVAAFAWNLAGWPVPDIAQDWGHKAAGAWSILGMMVAGIALARPGETRIHTGFHLWIGTVKLIVWPAMTYGFALIDAAWLGWYGRDVHVMLLVIGIVPVAGNLPAYATQLGLDPKEAALATVASTLFSILFIPAVFWVLQP